MADETEPCVCGTGFTCLATEHPEPGTLAYAQMVADRYGDLNDAAIEDGMGDHHPVADETNAGGLTGEDRESLGQRLMLTMTCNHGADYFGAGAVCETCWTNVQRVGRIIERIVAEREAAAREQGRAEADAGWAEVVGRLADEWANQPTDYDEDTEQQIEDGRTLRLILTADHSAALAEVKAQAAQEALRVSADAARNMSDPASAECAEWADWLDARADRLTTDTP